MIYLIGSLRNDALLDVSRQLRAAGHSVFDDWYAAGPLADDAWRDYEKARGFSYQKALKVSEAARHIFAFDKQWLGWCDTAVLALPAGRSAHLELGWMLGQRKRGIILLDDPDRWDVMYQFAEVVSSVPELLNVLRIPV